MVTDYSGISGENGQFYVSVKQANIERILALTQPYFTAIVRFLSDSNIEKAYLAGAHIVDKKYITTPNMIDMIRKHLCDEGTIDFKTMHSAFQNLDAHYRNITSDTKLYSKATMDVISKLESNNTNILLKNISQRLISDKNNKIVLHQQLETLLKSVLELPDRLGDIIKTHKYDPIHHEFGDNTFWNHSVPQVRYELNPGDTMLKLVELYGEIKQSCAFNPDSHDGRIWGSHYSLGYAGKMVVLGKGSQLLYNAASKDEGVKNFLLTNGYAAANQDTYLVGNYYRKSTSLWGSLLHHPSTLDHVKVMEDVSSALKLKDYVEKFVEDYHRLITIAGSTLEPTVQGIAAAFAKVTEAARAANIQAAFPSSGHADSLADNSTNTRQPAITPTRLIYTTQRTIPAESTNRNFSSGILPSNPAPRFASTPGIDNASTSAIAPSSTPEYASALRYGATTGNMGGNITPNLAMGSPLDQLAAPSTGVFPGSNSPSGNYGTPQHSIFSDLIHALQASLQANSPAGNNDVTRNLTDDIFGRDDRHIGHEDDDFLSEHGRDRTGEEQMEHDDRHHITAKNGNWHSASSQFELLTDKDGKHLTILFKDDSGVADVKNFTIENGKLIEDKNSLAPQQEPPQTGPQGITSSNDPGSHVPDISSSPINGSENSQRENPKNDIAQSTKETIAIAKDIPAKGVPQVTTGLPQMNISNSPNNLVGSTQEDAVDKLDSLLD